MDKEGNRYSIMFAFLRGTVAAKTVDHIELDVGGVGYMIFVPDSVHRVLVPGHEATLITYCHIREEAFLIFGFLREEERALFKMLLGVSGVGPKVALAILSSMNPSAIGNAIRDNDVTAFTKVGGVGKKTAMRVILEMKSKLGQDAELEAILGGGTPSEDEEGDDVLAALMALGCTHLEAKRASAKARKNSGDDATDEDLVKAALRTLAKV